MAILTVFLLLLQVELLYDKSSQDKASQDTSVVLDNPYFHVSKNAAPCATAAAGCGDRVIVALGDVTFRGKQMRRGDIVVFGAADRPAISYDPPMGRDYLEVVLKPGHPPVQSPPVMIAPEKNDVLYDGAHLFIFEEKLDSGETRARHSHRQRLVVVLNETRLQQWPDGGPEVFKNQVPDDVHFNEPVVHKVKTIGEKPLRNIVIELKP
jgi:hypothetical protein